MSASTVKPSKAATVSDVGDIRRLAESFEIALAARNLSPRTVRTYLEPRGQARSVERARRADHARKAYVLGLAYRSAKVRAAPKAGGLSGGRKREAGPRKSRPETSAAKQARRRF